MFLCFHSKDPIITDIITKNALKLFEGIENFNFSKDVEFLNKILPEPKLRTISGKETKETKAQLLESDDATSLALSEFSDLQNNLRQDITKLEDLTVVTKLLYAFSAVKVLGQILRRYLTGDLDDRILFTKQCYDLGLKTIKFIISEIENHVPELQSDLATAILERNPSLSSREVSDATTDWIWLLTESICLSSIKNTSHNVGAPELGRVYNILLERYPSLAYEFIDISIELDHFKELPEGKIEKLAIKLDQTKNYFSKDLLCLIFTYHIYQVYTPMFKIQKMCSVLGLQRLLSEPNIFLSSRKTLPRK